MTRYGRILGISGYMHIIARGINRQNIFYDDDDRMSFLKALVHIRNEMEFEVTAYCLMDNHIHLIIHDDMKRYSLIMKRLLIRYVYHFNEKYSRTGPLFENRFSSECIESIRYLVTAVKYIHNNPEKAGICKTDRYRWSSYGEYVGKAHICSTGSVLQFFSSMENFIQFHKAIIKDNYMELEGIQPLSDDEAAHIICAVMKCGDPSSIQSYNKPRRDALIKDFKGWGISSKQIARITGLSIYIISHVRINKKDRCD